MTTNIVPLRQRDPLLTPREVVAYVGRADFGYDRAREICRRYGIRPGGKPHSQLFIKRSVLETCLTAPGTLTETAKEPPVQPKKRRQGRSWI